MVGQHSSEIHNLDAQIHDGVEIHHPGCRKKKTKAESSMNSKDIYSAIESMKSHHSLLKLVP
jgi:hypothetical protein